MYQEAFETKGEAFKREIEIKNKKSRKYIEWVISSAIERPAQLREGHRFDSVILHQALLLKQNFFMPDFFVYILYSPTIDQDYFIT